MKDCVYEVLVPHLYQAVQERTGCQYDQNSSIEETEVGTLIRCTAGNVLLTIPFEFVRRKPAAPRSWKIDHKDKRLEDLTVMCLEDLHPGQVLRGPLVRVDAAWQVMVIAPSCPRSQPACLW